MVAARVMCAFRLGSHTFPEKITTVIVFCIGHGLLPVLVCDNAISQTVPEPLHTIEHVPESSPQIAIVGGGHEQD